MKKLVAVEFVVDENSRRPAPGFTIDSDADLNDRFIEVPAK